jgi:hypothetical protein
MDKQQAQQVFNDEILSRWPEFQLSPAMMGDWISFLSKFTPEQAQKAIRQYVLNFDVFKKPALNKFREIINAQNVVNDFHKKTEEQWPQYFLQCDSSDCPYWGYGTFTQINLDSQDQSACIRQMQQIKLSYISLYGGHWNIIVCNDIAERELLVKDRSEKNRITKIEKQVDQEEKKFETTDSLTDFFKDVI